MALPLPSAAEHVLTHQPINLSAYSTTKALFSRNIIKILKMSSVKPFSSAFTVLGDSLYIIAHIAEVLGSSGARRSLANLSAVSQGYKDICRPIIKRIKKSYQVVKADGVDCEAWKFNEAELTLIQ